MTIKFLGGGGASVTNFGPSADGKTFAGKAPAGSTVSVLKNGTQDGTATADASGLWSYTFTTAPAAGDAVVARAPVSSTAYTVPAGIPTLGPTTASFTVGAAANTVIASITGLQSGETASSIAPNDGRVALAGSGTTIVVGSTASSAGSTNYTVTTSQGRTLTIAITATAASLVNMTGAAARVAITDTSYWIRTGGTLARTTDTTYETNLKNSSTAKNIPMPSQSIPSGSIGYVSLKLPATTADSPPLFINWDGNAALPSATSPLAPTVWYSDDSVTGSPDDGTWTQYPASQFTLYRPTAATDPGYTGRGQALYHDVEPANRWRQVRFDVTVSGATQAVLPHICCSSGQWLWVIGNSVFRNQFSSSSTVNAERAAIIAAVSGADPFFFATCRSGSNQTGILDEQVNPTLASATRKKFLRGVYCNPWLGDIAFAGVRPYSSASQATRDAIRARSDSIFDKVKSLGITVVASDMTWGNYLTSAPTMSSDLDLQSVNGNVPWMLNVTGPGHKLSLPSAWDTAYDWPIVCQSASMANLGSPGYGTNDDVHPNGTPGFTTFRAAENPNWRMLYGQAPGANTMQTIVSGLGSSTTVAKKQRAQAVFDMLVAAYPTNDSTANSNRATLRSQLDGLAAA